MPNIEIEHRARFGEGKYIELKRWLEEKIASGEVKDLGEDNREAHFFVFKDKFFKVTKNISKDFAKICLKMNKIGQGADAEEIEVEIKPADVPTMVKICQETMAFDTYVPSNQKRHNYIYQGVELALKHSDEWGYHLELEVMIDDLAKKPEAEKLIEKVSGELGVQIMTDQELEHLTSTIEAKNK